METTDVEEGQVSRRERYGREYSETCLGINTMYRRALVSEPMFARAEFTEVARCGGRDGVKEMQDNTT